MARKFGGTKINFSTSFAAPPLNYAIPASTSSYESHFQGFRDTSPKSELHYGSYTSDLALAKYTHEWDSLDHMKIWLKQQEEENFIEFVLKETIKSQRAWKVGWIAKHIYVCARQGSGGIKKYTKKLDRDRKVPSKRCSCSCRLVVMCYPNTKQVLGIYEDQHSHVIGHSNARFTRLPVGTRIRIAEMLRLGIEPKRIVSNEFNVRHRMLANQYFSSQIFKAIYSVVTTRRNQQSTRILSHQETFAGSRCDTKPYSFVLNQVTD